MNRSRYIFSPWQLKKNRHFYNLFPTIPIQHLKLHISIKQCCHFTTFLMNNQVNSNKNEQIYM